MKLKSMTKAELDVLARDAKVVGRSKMTKPEIVNALLQPQRVARAARFGVAPEQMTPKQRRRVQQKLNRFL